MDKPFKKTGGARIGWETPSFPSAKLWATPDQLTISFLLQDAYLFAPDQVLTIEKYVVVPFLMGGIQIHHCKTTYPRIILFKCFGNPDTVLRGIHEAGFLPSPSSLVPPQPFVFTTRWSRNIMSLVAWSILVLIFFRFQIGNLPMLGVLVLCILIFAFELLIDTLIAPRLQRPALKPDGSGSQIRPILRVCAFASGILLMIFSILLVIFWLLWINGAYFKL